MTRAATAGSFVAFALACSPHGSLGRDLPEETGDETGDDAGASTSLGSDESTDTEHGTTAHQSSSDDGSTGHGDGSSSTGPADACAPVVEDDACLACRKAQCCEVWTACLADEVCVCIETCIEGGGDAACLLYTSPSPRDS